MGVTTLVAGLGAKLGESQNQKDKRVEDLWRRLDAQRSGYLDFRGLKQGLQKIDHPMKNADGMLRQIMTMVDTNSDGKIDYEEFRAFVDQTEKELSRLFSSIDHDGNGKLDKGEMQAAFKQSGMTIPARKLDAFFRDMDLNNDGYISFTEWRDFLLFMPVYNDDIPLQDVLRYYSSMVSLTAEGESMVPEEIVKGSGTSAFFLNSLFGSLLRIASPLHYTPSSAHISPPFLSPSSSNIPVPPSPDYESSFIADRDVRAAHQFQEFTAPGVLSAVPDASQPDDMDARNLGPIRRILDGQGEADAVREAVSPGGATDTSSSTSASIAAQRQEEQGSQGHSMKSWLTDYLPEPGYFVAGAAAGGLSRTATAPLDRLKVHLLVSTTPRADMAVTALKQGRPLLALYNAGKPITDGFRDLWRAGGIRSLFAGNGLNVIKIMPESAIKFGSYEAAKSALAKLEGHNDPKSISAYSGYVAGGVAGMIAQFSVYPLDTLKFRLQTSTVAGGPTGNALVIDTAKNMWKTGGVRGAYRGVTMGLLGMFPYSAIDMGTFEFLKTSYHRYMAKRRGIHEEDVQTGNIVTGIMGATSGAFGACVVYPLNVFRTRLQTQGTAMHPATYTGIVDVARKTIQNEGLRGMYKGLAPNLLKVAPALSITWVVYENAKRLLHLP
ncbi:hypothetical protein ACRALDRAFT_1077391 [Sodiomyces alcalophilus JCM 7366]|uniref:uncharacterized protein n=1 Tax=Sodiomyces alcalophilus JCM 7366 TaxID=591952 RepID=UPI0039B57860